MMNEETNNEMSKVCQSMMFAVHNNKTLNATGWKYRPDCDITFKIILENQANYLRREK